MRPIVNLTFTLDQLREMRRLLAEAGGDAVALTIEVTNAQTGEVSETDRTLPLAVIERAIAMVEASERHQRN